MFTGRDVRLEVSEQCNGCTRWCTKSLSQVEDASTRCWSTCCSNLQKWTMSIVETKRLFGLKSFGGLLHQEPALNNNCWNMFERRGKKAKHLPLVVESKSSLVYWANKLTNTMQWLIPQFGIFHHFQNSYWFACGRPSSSLLFSLGFLALGFVGGLREFFSSDGPARRPCSIMKQCRRRCFITTISLENKWSIGQKRGHHINM